MATKKQVSEKTLELNICAEILPLIRSISGCSSAFWIGMKQDQEARWGIDELISNVPRGVHLALQFKSPWSKPENTAPYKFSINDRQHHNLLRLARHRPNGVLYVFPHYNTMSRLRTDSPAFQDTWFVRVEDWRSLPNSSRSNGSHLVKSFGGYAIAHSEPVKATSMGIKEAISSSLPGIKNSGLELEILTFSLLSHSDLKEWLFESFKQVESDRRAFANLLRGFSTVCISPNF